MTYQAMTKSRWLGIVNDHASELRELVANYHPSATAPRRKRMPITTTAPEAACEMIREQIKAEAPTDPLARWDKAISEQNISEINSLLNDAWFGVPESTECWSIPGFGIACDLMDDLPEPEEGDL